MQVRPVIIRHARLGQIIVDAHLSGVDGLVYHLSVWGEPVGYRVTHESSGKSLVAYWFPTQDEAELFCRLAGLALAVMFHDPEHTSPLTVWDHPDPLSHLTPEQRRMLGAFLKDRTGHSPVEPSRSVQEVMFP